MVRIRSHVGLMDYARLWRLILDRHERAARFLGLMLDMCGGVIVL